MGDAGAAITGTGANRNGTHVTVGRDVAIRVMQLDVDPEGGGVILRIGPARVHDPVRIGSSVDRPIAQAEVNAIMTVVGHPATQVVRPVDPEALVTDARLRRRGTGRSG